MSAKAELGTLVRIPIECGNFGNFFRNESSIKPSLKSFDLTISNFLRTVERLARISKTCTDSLAWDSQKFNLPTIITPSSCFGKNFKDLSVDDHATPSTLAWPSVNVNHRWPFFNWDLETVAVNINFGANPRESNKPIDLFNSFTLYVGKDSLGVLRFGKLLREI